MTEPTLDLPKKKIVVVEDDEDFIALIRMMLSNPQFEIIAATNGARGLEAIQRQHPDLVILDLMLPDMHGWEIYMRLQGDKETQQIPVIILTSQGTRHDRNFSLQVAHVHDYLMKPCLPSQLRQSVTAALNRQPALVLA
jgi:DNA-binding response OmpR family regulator